jgi:DNA end-binding protein Ku
MATASSARKKPASGTKSEDPPPKKPQPAPSPQRASARGVWSGQLRLALVSFPVELVSAVKPGARLAFHQVDAKSRRRIHYEKVAPGVGKVAPENVVKGYEISKGNYVLVEDEDLERVKLEATKVIDLVQFVDHCEVDPLFYDKPYYVLADGKLAAEAYTVLRDAMRETGKMGLGQFVMRGREYVAALRPCGEGLLLETLRFGDEVRAAAPFFTDLPDKEPDPELLELAEDLIRRKTAKFDPDRFHDRYTEALRQVIEAKAKHQVAVADVTDETPADRGNVIDLVEALRRSVRENSEPTENPSAGSAKSPRKRPRSG